MSRTEFRQSWRVTLAVVLLLPFLVLGACLASCTVREMIEALKDDIEAEERAR